MGLFEIGIKKIRHGYIIINADNKEDAIRKVENKERGKLIMHHGETTQQLDCVERKAEDIDL